MKKDPMRNLLCLLIIINTPMLISAQVEITSTVIPEITVCGNSETFTIKVKNNQFDTLVSVLIPVDLPAGIVYENGSLTEQTSLNLQENNISNLQSPVFSCETIFPYDSLEFRFKILAKVQSVSYQQAGNVFRNNVTINHSSGSESHTSNAYNILYPSLNILAVSPSSQSVVSGDTILRSITIVNAGYGRTNKVTLSDQMNNLGVSIIETDIGSLNGSADTIVLLDVDFNNIGNNDNFLDYGESIVVTQKLVATGCSALTVTSDITALWGCDNESVSTNISYGNISVTLKNPTLATVVSSETSSCFGIDSSVYTLTIINSGLGHATNLEILIQKSTGNGYNQDIFSSIDPNSFYYQKGVLGSQISFSPETIFTRSDGPYSCLGTNPVGEITYTLPFDLAPGDSCIIHWKKFQCCVSSCLNEGNMGWEYKVTYENYCQTNTYSKSGTPEQASQLDMSVFTETPSDISTGQTLPFIYTISSLKNNLPQGNGAHYEVEFTLDQGITIANPTTDLQFTSNSSVWTPFSVSYNNNTKKLVAKYPLPAPFTITKSELELNITGDCSETGGSSGNKSILLNIYYVADTTCSGSCKVEMICNELIEVNLHCPSLNCQGVQMSGFGAVRVNFGEPDNNIDGLPDNSGSLNLSKVKERRLMVNDTLKTTKYGVVRGASEDIFKNLFAQSEIQNGIHLTYVEANIRIYDASENSYIQCDSISEYHYDIGTSRVFRFDIVPGNLLSFCPAFASSNSYGYYVFEDGDSLWLEVKYALTGNIENAITEVLIENDLFLSDLTNPWNSASGRFFCDVVNGKFTMVGYYFANSWKNNYSVTSCSKVVQQNFWMSIGNCCSNYNGGNLFPYEYRNWGHIKELEVNIPGNYEVLNMYMKQRRTKKTNSSSTQTINTIVPYYNTGTVLKFNLEQYYEAYGGTLKYSDDGFNGTVYIELAPTCDVPVNTYEDITWKYKFEKSNALGGGETGWITTNSDRIKFTPTDLVLSSTNPYVDGLGRNVEWDLKIKNNTSNTDAANSWLHIKNPSEEMEIIAVLDDNGDTLELQGDIYFLGEIKKNKSVDLSIISNYSACAPDYIVAYAGYECSAYPDSFALFTCPYTTYGLYVEPKSTAQQARISGTTVGENCSNIVELSVELSSVEFGHLDSIEVEIIPVGESMIFIENSGALDFPQNGNYESIPDPTTITNGYNYKLMQVSNDLERDGLPGVLSLPNNKLKLRFQMNIESNFKTGDYVQIKLLGKAICGTIVPDIILAYDPTIVLNKNTSAGLSGDISDTWGVAWIDYNNDGFEDVFATDYSLTRGNFLYKNNGNGTFSKITTGELVNDAENTVSSTWGDYDNDGDLDVFLSNNTGGENKLYTNNGNGTFTKGTTGEINNYGGYCHNASWIDYDNDGHLDLFVTDYMPTKFNKLYHNNGDGSFSMVLTPVIVNEAFHSIGTTWGDYDNDGDVDAFVPNTNGQNNALYRNDGNGQFFKITTGDIVNQGGKSVGCSWGDYNNDGYLDLFVANTGGENDFLYKNNQDGTFSTVVSGVVVNTSGNSSGSSWVDVDNDADLDLFVSSDLGSSSHLYTNDGSGNFVNQGNTLNDVVGNSYPNAWGDYDNDGDLDLFIGNRSGEQNVFFTNDRASCNNWYCAKLQGTLSNRSAIGAKIRIKANINGQNVWQLREISAQTGGGTGSQNTLRAMFGLGNAVIVDSVKIEWPSGVTQYLTSQSINGCNDIVEPTGNYVCGTVFYDVNSNCLQDSSEAGIPNVLLEILPGSKYVTTNSLGEYSVYLENGSYTVRQIVGNNWQQQCPSENASLNFNVADNSVCGFNFSNGAVCTNPDLAVSLGATALRRGFRNQISISYNNESPTPDSNVVVQLEVDNSIIPVSASMIWEEIQQGENTTIYQWNIGVVAAFSHANIDIEDSVDLFASLGEQVELKAIISSGLSDCNNDNNSMSTFEKIVGSVDPNDKLVYPGRSDGGIQQVTQKDRLTYTIRFQNVGNYYASRVIIIDTLSTYLDPATIKFEASSHDFDFRVNENTIIWTIFGIELPDSSLNYAASQGFVKFSIQPKISTPHNALIKNSGAIQFDYNEYLITNSTVTKVVNPEVIKKQGLWVKAFPNPTSDKATLVANTPDSNYVIISKVEIFSITGKHLTTIEEMGKEEINVSLKPFEKGIYLLVVYDEFYRSAVVNLVKL